MVARPKIVLAHSELVRVWSSRSSLSRSLERPFDAAFWRVRDDHETSKVRYIFLCCLGEVRGGRVRREISVLSEQFPGPFVDSSCMR